MNALDHPDTVHTRDLIDRCFHMAIRDQIAAKENKFALYIEPPAMTRFGIFDISHFDEIFQAGYQYVRSIPERVEAFQKSL
jgi:NTE family protein